MRILEIRICLSFLLFFAAPTQALTVKQLIKICQSQQTEHKLFCETCVGGTLDAIALLNHEAKRRDYPPMYCKHKRKIFDIQKIHAFIKQSESRWGDKNATLPIVEYLQNVGACEE